MRITRENREHRTCKCGGNMPHRYSYDFVRGLYRAQCICEKCGRRTATQYARRQQAAITAAYAATRTFARTIE